MLKFISVSTSWPAQLKTNDRPQEDSPIKQGLA